MQIDVPTTCTCNQHLWQVHQKVSIRESSLAFLVYVTNFQVKLILACSPNIDSVFMRGFQMAEVLVSKRLFQEILERIHRLKPVPIGYG